MRRPLPEPPLRPLLAPALALGSGALLGLGPADGGPWPRATLLGLGVVAWLVVARRARVGASTALLFLLAGVHAALRSPAPAPATGTSGWTRAAVQAARQRPIVGRWRAAGPRSGWVEPFAGDAGHAGHTLLLEPALWRPPEGTPVVVLPGSAVWPWPRGPKRASDVRTRAFAAWSPVGADELVLLGSSPGLGDGRPSRWLTELRQRMHGRLARLEGPAARGLLSALLLGEREGLERERADLFTRTGTRHLLAISGWHVGLFALLVLEPLVRLARRLMRVQDERLPALLRGLGLASYALLTGAGKPVVRAALMLGVAGLGNALAQRAGRPRPPDALSLLAAAFALEALLDPGALRTPSLALSYSATLGLVLGHGPLCARLGRLGRALLGPRRAAWRATWFSVSAARLARALNAGLAASCAALLATLPLAWTVFGEVVPVGALVTVLAAPLVAALTGLAWIGLVSPGAVLVPLIEGCGGALVGLLEWADRLPGTPWAVPARPLALLALATMATFLGLRGRAGAGRLAAALHALVLLPWSAAPRGLELVALDVGHGTALALRAPGLEALVFDAGSRDRRGIVPRALLPLLTGWEVAAPVLVLSHVHLDHAGGLESLARRLAPAGLWGATPAQGGVRGAHAAARPTQDLGRGWTTIPESSRELEVRLLRGSSEPGNEGSRALLVTWRGRRILLLGDAEEQGLEGLELPPGPLRLLLAPHHGSEARGLARLLERAPPEEVWISASHPPAIARELERRRLRWRWTGAEGPLALCLP